MVCSSALKDLHSFFAHNINSVDSEKGKCKPPPLNFKGEQWAFFPSQLPSFHAEKQHLSQPYGRSVHATIQSFQFQSDILRQVCLQKAQNNPKMPFPHIIIWTILQLLTDTKSQINVFAKTFLPRCSFKFWKLISNVQMYLPQTPVSHCIPRTFMFINIILKSH